MQNIDSQHFITALQSLANEYEVNALSDNSNTVQGFVSNPAIATSDSTYHFHSLEKVNRGDYITIDDNYYMVTNDVIAKRGFKYKAIVEYCNYLLEITKSERVIIGYDNSGRPIYKESLVVESQNPAIVKFRGAIIEGSIIQLSTNTLNVTLQNNEKTRQFYKLNQVIVLDDMNFKIINVEYAAKGTIELRIEIVI